MVFALATLKVLLCCAHMTGHRTAVTFITYSMRAHNIWKVDGNGTTSVLPSTSSINWYPTP